MVYGMFDWVCRPFYWLTYIILKIIELISECCNMISGIDPIIVEGKTTGLFEYLFTSNRVTFAFGVAAVCGAIFTIFFSVLQIIINFSRDKSEETPITIFKKAVKNIFIAMCVPLFMYIFFIIGNAFVRAMYEGTSFSTTTGSISQFMFSIFAQDAVRDGNTAIFNNTVFWYSSWDTITKYLDMWSFDYFYSYIIGIIVGWSLLTTALMLVERVFSIILLYIISPVVIASSIMDDGAKFKLWREQVLIKFFTGFGAILGINVYLLIVALVTQEDIKFFTSASLIFRADVLNQFMKLLFIAGGAICMKQLQAIVGNIISQGAGDKAIAETQRANESFARNVGGAITAPFRGYRSLSNFRKDSGQYGFRNTLKNRLGMKNDWDYKRDIALAKERNEAGYNQATGNYNGNRPNLQINQQLQNANNPLNNMDGNNINNNNNNNQNRNSARAGQDMINSVIAGNNNNIN